MAAHSWLQNTTGQVDRNRGRRDPQLASRLVVHIRGVIEPIIDLLDPDDGNGAGNRPGDCVGGLIGDDATSKTTPMAESPGRQLRPAAAGHPVDVVMPPSGHEPVRDVIDRDDRLRLRHLGPAASVCWPSMTASVAGTLA